MYYIPNQNQWVDSEAHKNKQGGYKVASPLYPDLSLHSAVSILTALEV